MLFTLDDEIRGRLNGLYVASLFAECAIGSALAGFAYTEGGWTLAARAGLTLPVAAWVCLVPE
jgi:hypothetical protein